MKRGILAPIVLSCVVAAFPGAADGAEKPPPAEILALVAQAQLRLQAGEVTEGVKLLRKAQSLDPTNPELAEEFALALADAGMTDEALTVLREASSLTPAGEAAYGLLLAQGASDDAGLEKAVPHLERGVDNSPQTRLVLAQTLIRLGRGDKAWDALRPLLDERGDDPRILLLAGQARRLAGKFDEAAGYLRRAAETAELRPRATLELVETLAQAGSYREAADLLGGFIKKEGATLAAMSRWASLLARAGDKGKATEVLDDVLGKEPTFREALVLKALLEATDGHFDVSEQLYRRALAAYPGDPDIAMGFTRVLIETRRFAEARTQLDGVWATVQRARADATEAGFEVARERATLELMDRKPEAAREWLLRGGKEPYDRRLLALWAESFRLRQAWGDGLAFLAKAKVGPGDQERRLRAATEAEFRLASGDDAGGRKVLDALLGGDEGDVEAALAALQRRKLYAEVAVAARAALPRLKDAPGVRFTLAAGLERSGQWDEAVKEFRDLIAKQPENPSALNYLGYMFADKNVNLDEAATLLNKAVSLDPANGAFLDSLGWLYFRKGDLDRAEKYLTQSVTLEPFDGTVHEHLGDVHRARGHREKALVAYRQALALDLEETGQKERIEKKVQELEGAARP